MTEKSISFKSLFFLIYFFYNVILDVGAQETQGRNMPGCALVKSNIYCFGGFTKAQINEHGTIYSNALNEHITLDLQTLGNLSQFDQTKIQWKPVSNTFNGAPLSNIGLSATTPLSDDTYILYGGSNDTSVNSPNLAYPFLHYNPQTDAWNSLPMLANNTYATYTDIVNLDNGSIWVWGGTLNSTANVYTYDYGLFNYKISSWTNMKINTGEIRMDHTATLSNKGLIYIIGGYFKVNAIDDHFHLAKFSKIITYDTRTLAWDNIDASGSVPSDRGLHTTTATADGKSLLIYGGCKLIQGGLEVAPPDLYYIYDYYSNSFTGVELPENTLSNTSNNARFGHFAALYNSTYLILSFGYNDASSPAESLTILNVADPKKPVWAAGLDNSNTPNNNDNSKTLIPAIVVPVVVVLLAAATGLFFFIRHRKRERQNVFVLEQQDPRKKDVSPLDFTDMTSEATTEVNSNSLGRRSVELTKPFMMEYNNGNNNQTTAVGSNNSHVIDTTHQQQQQQWPAKEELSGRSPIKPFDPGH